jgi:hypothetical protein
MNLQTNDFVEYLGPDMTGDTVAEAIAEHHGMLAKAGFMATGEVALLSDPDPDMAGTGVLQVWSKTDEGMWVWINPEGEPVERACPVD